MEHGPNFVHPNDVEVFDKIDNTLSEYATSVEARRLEDHKMAMDAIEWYERWLQHEQNGD